MSPDGITLGPYPNRIAAHDPIGSGSALGALIDDRGV